MSLTTALFKRIIDEQNLDTWSSLKKDYIPKEFHSLFKSVEKYVENYHKVPTIEGLRLWNRDEATSEKIEIVSREEVELDSAELLEFLKAEFTEAEIFDGLTDYVENSIAFETAEESIQSIYNVIAKVEQKVELVKPQDNIQKVELFDSKEDIEMSLELGLNNDWDAKYSLPKDALVLIGGHRGAGKSVVANNILKEQKDQGKNALKFSLEMTLKQELQRLCAIETGINPIKIRHKELSVQEWEKIAYWWGCRYENGKNLYFDYYLNNRDFEKFHSLLIQHELNQPVIDIHCEPAVTLSKFKAEVLKRLHKYGNIGCIVVDYLNKMKVSNFSYDKFDWKDQLMVSEGLKTFAEEINIPIVAMFQTKKDGTAKWGSDIDVPADISFTLEAGSNYIEFDCTKSRHFEAESFISEFDKNCLKVGPENGIKVTASTDDSSNSEETPFDI